MLVNTVNIIGKVVRHILPTTNTFFGLTCSLNLFIVNAIRKRIEEH